MVIAKIQWDHLGNNIQHYILKSHLSTVIFFFTFRCNCEAGLCGPQCNLDDPCQPANVCANGGVCVEDCRADEADYVCKCTNEYAGKNCTEVVSIFKLRRRRIQHAAVTM